MDALEAIQARRAVRAYKPALVSDADIRVLLDAAVHAPTAMHEEPWRFAIVQDRALLRRISDRAKQRLATPRQLPENIFYDAGTLIVICTGLAGPFVQADCWLAAENLMLAATARGLATCPIGFAVAALQDDDLRAELALPAGTVAVAPIIVGYAAAPVPVSPRREPVIASWRR